MRTEEFKRNNRLELLLNELNDNLYIAEKKLLEKDTKLDFPIIIIIGPLRSGTTLFLQWLAKLGIVAYPTNLMSRFYKAPIIGAKIQLLLTDKRYNYRNEILDFNSEINFISENGKTRGALAPNEFWYFWRRFLPFKEIDYLPDEELFEKVNVKELKAEFSGITTVFKKPFALKGMILNYNIPFLDAVLEKVIFVRIKRNPIANIASALQARERQYGTTKEWYSFKIPEYYKLKDLDPIEQVAGQIFYTNRAIEKGLEKVPSEKKLVVEYENFCKNPVSVYEELIDKLNLYGLRLDEKYNGEKSFNITRSGLVDIEIQNAYNKFISAGYIDN